MTDERDNDSVHMTPPLADLSGKEAPTPGPLTKPVAIVRTPKRRGRRWLLSVILLLVLAAAVGIVWMWSSSAGSDAGSGAISSEAIEHTFRAVGLFTA